MTDIIKMNVLHLLTRNDMPLSMKNGRPAAQSSHATSVFHKRFEDYLTDPASYEPTDSISRFAGLYEEWKNTTPYGYGTVLVRTASLDEMESLHDLRDAYDFYSEIVIDPEYKLQDGAFTFTAHDVPTSMYIFGTSNHVYQNFIKPLRYL